LTPSVNDGNINTEWRVVNKDTKLKLSGVYDLDGLKALAVFTDEAALVEWAKQPREYIALGMTPIIDICKDLGIARLVINSGQPTMFVLERNLENIKTHEIKEQTTVQVGTPNNPLNQKLINNLIKNFEKVSTITEAYQYAQTMNGEFSIVLGIRLSVVSENSRLAVNAAVTNAIGNEKLNQPLDVMILQTDDWLETVRGISNSLFYKSHS
jgi:hypothetical protein